MRDGGVGNILVWAGIQENIGGRVGLLFDVIMFMMHDLWFGGIGSLHSEGWRIGIAGVVEMRF